MYIQSDIELILVSSLCAFHLRFTAIYSCLILISPRSSASEKVVSITHQ